MPTCKEDWKCIILVSFWVLSHKILFLRELMNVEVGLEGTKYFMHIHHQKCVSSRENRMKGRKWMFACGFLRLPRRCAPFLTAFQAREAKIPCSFLSAFGPLPCSCTAVVRSAPMAILSDGGVHRTSHTSVHSTNTRRVSLSA